MDKLIEGLTLDMLPEGLYRMIAEAIGTENFYKLAKVVGGTTVYIPKPESITRPVRDARIKEEFNGYNHPELAKKYGVTERWVRRICGQGQTEGQLDIFDYFGSDPGQEGDEPPPVNANS